MWLFSSSNILIWRSASLAYRSSDSGQWHHWRTLANIRLDMDSTNVTEGPSTTPISTQSPYEDRTVMLSSGIFLRKKVH